MDTAIVPTAASHFVRKSDNRRIVDTPVWFSSTIIRLPLLGSIANVGADVASWDGSGPAYKSAEGATAAPWSVPLS